MARESQASGPPEERAVSDQGDDSPQAGASGRDGLSALQGRRILVLEDSVLIAAEIAANLAELGAVVVGPHLDVSGARGALEWDAHLIDGAILTPVAQDAPTDPVAEKLLEKGVPFVLVAGSDRDQLAPVFHSAPLCRKPLVIDELFGHLSSCLKRT
jgi:hypothetical protein